jgi:hypothetical protein
MPKETGKIDEKKEFALKAMDRQLAFTQLCHEYGISTKTGYKRRKRIGVELSRIKKSTRHGERRKY